MTALARYQYSDQLDIEMGLARKVRSPNLYERYTWSSWAMAATMNNFVGDGNGYVGDVNLEPETAYTLSTTFDWHAADRSWNVTATPFYTHVDNYIDAVALPTWGDDQFNVLQYAESVGQTLRYRTCLHRYHWAVMHGVNGASRASSTIPTAKTAIPAMHCITSCL